MGIKIVEDDECLPSPPSILSFLRHGESVTNDLRPGYCFDSDDVRDEARRRCGGTLANQDVPLSQLGIEQAKEAGPRVWAAIGAPRVIYCSPYRRARDTLQRLLETFPADVVRPTVIFDTRIRERESAPVSNMTEDEVRRHFPWLEWHHANTGDFYFRYPSGESLADLVDGRVRDFLAEVHQSPVGENTLVVTHGNFIKCARLILEGWPPDQLYSSSHVNPSNCGLVEYRVKTDADGKRRMSLHSID